MEEKTTVWPIHTLFMQNENSRHGMHSPSLKQTRTNVAEVETEKLHAHFRLGAEYRHTRDMTPIMCHFGSSSYSLSNINSWHCSRPYNFPFLAKSLLPRVHSSCCCYCRSCKTSCKSFGLPCEYFKRIPLICLCLYPPQGNFSSSHKCQL